MKFPLRLIAAAALVHNVALAAGSDTTCPRSTLCGLVASSIYVVQGKLEIAPDAIANAMNLPDRHYFEMRVSVEHVYRGEAPIRSLTIQYPLMRNPKYWRPDALHPDALSPMNQRRVLAFVQEWRGEHFLSDLANGTGLAIYTPQAAERIRAEVERQAALVRKFDDRIKSRPQAMDAEVEALVKDALVADTGPVAFDALIRLDPVAIPAIVKRMDDRRALPFPSVGLATRTLSRDRLEGRYHSSHRPKLAVDLLDVVLSELSGQSFGSVADGGPEALRRAVIQGWKFCVASRNPDCVVGNAPGGEPSYAAIRHAINHRLDGIERMGPENRTSFDMYQTHDLDGDGQKELVISYSVHQLAGPTEEVKTTVRVAAFRNRKGRLRFQDEIVGDMARYDTFRFIETAGRRILISAKEKLHPHAATLVFELRNGKLLQI